MPTDTAHEKQQVHELIERLAPSQVAAVRGLLEVMLDPQRHATNGVPFDDEPFTNAERRAVGEADEWLKHNQPIPHEEVLAELSLTMAVWESMAKAPIAEETPQGSG